MGCPWQVLKLVAHGLAFALPLERDDAGADQPRSLRVRLRFVQTPDAAICVRGHG